MLILVALRHRALSRLWIGQALSSIGDEIYRVGLTWLAIGLIGLNTGYLAAGQAAALMIFSFVGGKWADHWHPLRAMIRIDLLRMLIVLIPVVASYFTQVNLPLLFVVALAISGLSAFFDPALHSCLPRISSDRKTLKAANGLMSTTIRMARLAGPAIVGLFSGLIPMIHFFTLDAISFGISAYCVHSLTRGKKAHALAPAPDRPNSQSTLCEAIVSGFKATRTVQGFSFVMWTKAITGGTWNLAVTMGFALLVHQLTGGNAQSFGIAIASYGLGNFCGALTFANFRRENSYALINRGHFILGLGFVAIGLSTSIFWLLIFAPLTGFFGPLGDLAFADLVQREYDVTNIVRIYRLRTALETASTLILMLVSPWLFQLLGVGTTISCCGLIWMACGIAGTWLQPNSVSLNYKLD